MSGATIHRGGIIMNAITLARTLGTGLVMLTLAGGALSQEMEGMGEMDEGMAGMAEADAPKPPAVFGYGGGEAVHFLHTEASDEEIARILTDMMGGSPVLLVPSLAEAPDAMTAPVYVFTNGVEPEGPKGPLGFQPDVFPALPGEPAYTPLREVTLATWADDADPAQLQSAGEVEAAVAEGQLALEATGVIVNMPLLTWPGGTR